MSLDLPRYEADIAPDDPDANFKEEVAAVTRQDPLPTLENLSAATGIPVPALVRYILVRWTSEGHEMLLHTGPRLLRRMQSLIDDAEAAGTDAARLEAYRSLSQIVAWLGLPLEQDTSAPPG